MQRPCHIGEHLSIKMSRLYSRCDISLKIRNQTGSVRVPAVGAVAQALQQLLQQKQITEGKRFIVAPWRHVASNALKGDKDLARGAFEVQIEIRRERRRPALDDCSRNASRMSIHRRGLWLGSAHHAASSNRAMLPPGPVPDSSKSVKSTTDFGAWGLVQNTAALLPVGCEARSFVGQASDEFFDYTRSVSVNTDPLPGSLAKVTSSPIIRASLRQIARRSPVPPPAERARVALPSRLAARRTVAAQGASGRPSCRLFAYATPAAASIASTIDGSSFPGLGHQLIGIGGDDCKSPNPFA